jgi:hypothetical protein
MQLVHTAAVLLPASVSTASTGVSSAATWSRTASSACKISRPGVAPVLQVADAATCRTCGKADHDVEAGKMGAPWRAAAAGSGMSGCTFAGPSGLAWPLPC